MPKEVKKNRLLILSILLLLASIIIGFSIYYMKKETYRGIIYSCSGWQLNRLPEVKNFIQNDLNHFNVEVQYIGGKPRLVIYSSSNKTIEEIQLAPYNRKQLNELFESKGLKK